MNLPKVLKRVLFDYNQLKDIDTYRTEMNLEFEAEAIRQLVGIGLMINNFKHKINDESFLAEIKQMTNADTMFEYLESLDDNRLSALKTAVELTRDNKYKQRTLT